MSKVQRSVVLTYCYLERAKCFQESGKPGTCGGHDRVEPWTSH